MRHTHANVFEEARLQNEYLTSLRDFLTGFSLRDPCYTPAFQHSSMLKVVPFDHRARDSGRCWPTSAYSMAGRRRLDNVRDLLTAAILNHIPGAFLEAGVWRGGSSIMAAGTILAFKESRDVFVCDSFQGLPRSSNPMDYDGWEVSDVLAVPLATVRVNFQNSGLLAPNVKFIKGFFNDSLPKLARQTFKIAVLRADGDMYESTMDILFNLYDKLSVGGFLIIDDWEVMVARKAVKHFFYIHSVKTIRVEDIDGVAVYIVKESHFNTNRDWYERFNKKRQVLSSYTSKKQVNFEKTGKCPRFPFSCLDEFSFAYADMHLGRSP